MRANVRAYTVLVFAVAGACTVQLADLTGRACDDDHACPAPLVCHLEKCLRPEDVLVGPGDPCSDAGVGMACANGQGQCRAEGVLSCDAGVAFCTAVPTDAGPMKLAGDTYAVHYFRYMFGFDLNGKLAWAYSHPRVQLVASDHTGAAIVGVSANGELVALDPKTGAVRWRQSLGLGQPVLGATFDADGWTPRGDGEQVETAAAPWRELSPDWLSDGVSPNHAPSADARSKRCQSPPSSRWIDNAVKVSMPLNARNLATVDHHCSSIASRDSCRAIAALRADNPSTAASKSPNTRSLASWSKRCSDSQRRCSAVHVVALG